MCWSRFKFLDEKSRILNVSLCASIIDYLEGKKASIDHSSCMNIIFSELLLFSFHSSRGMQEAKYKGNVQALEGMF